MRKAWLAGWCVVTAALAGIALAQEQVDPNDPAEAGPVKLADYALRVRVVEAKPAQKQVQIRWRRGGMGLGGVVVSGTFLSDAKSESIDVGAWTAPLPLADVAGKTGWGYPNLLIDALPDAKKKREPLTSVAVEFEFLERGKPFKKFVETSPEGNNVSAAVHLAAVDRKMFRAETMPLAQYAKNRREMVEGFFPDKGPTPKKFAMLGILGGYGPGAGFGIRHNNPAIVADECRTQQALGFNGLVGKKSLDQADAAGFGDAFRRLQFGGPGAGSPMNFFKKDVDGCPFDPALRKYIAERTAASIDEHKQSGARESWAEWVDEIGVAAKEHHQQCPRCAAAYREYVKALGVTPADLGQASWDRVVPYPLWTTSPKAKGPVLAKAPKEPTDTLNYYYSFRFMTHATADLFPEAAERFKTAGIPLFAMQGPTPSWNGSSLDWWEFYDRKANSACVWETSNRDPRTWQFESYLADIMRSIAAKLRALIGTLVKPHRGAPEQRSLAAVTRGARAIEWYTYGPDYARGDSFSQRPDLLERVGKVNRFFAAAEDWLYGADWLAAPQVAFVSPRSSEIWGKATPLDVTAFENAKWVYLALRHAHVPVDVLGEADLAEFDLSKYRAIYVPGTHLHSKSAAKLRAWVEAGGTLWTDALGLSRDEANQPTTWLGANRTHESWGSVEGYRAVGLAPLKESNAPAHAKFTWSVDGTGEAVAGIGREPLDATGAAVLGRFADGKPAVVRREVGRGAVVSVGVWAGLTYSAKVRRPDYDMRADFDPALRRLIAAPALERDVVRPAVPSDPLVEAVALTNAGQRSVALMNWAYRYDAKSKNSLQPRDKLRVDLPRVGPIASVRSLRFGPLPLAREGTVTFVIVPRIDEVDVLLVD